MKIALFTDQEQDIAKNRRAGTLFSTVGNVHCSGIWSIAGYSQEQEGKDTVQYCIMGWDMVYSRI